MVVSFFDKCTKARAKKREVPPMGSANRRAPYGRKSKKEKRGGDERGKTAAPAIIITHQSKPSIQINLSG